MLIRELALRDFRQYRGCQTIDLTVDWGSERNIVLIGGLNGAGKTTLMKALRLVLFGKLNEDLWHRSSYGQFIRTCINSASFASGCRDFSLEAELDVGDVHDLATLRVSRQWRLDGRGELASESLRLFGNGKEKLGLTAEEAELLIQEHLPYGISQFAFFDGEKIQDLARRELFGLQVRSAVESVLGLTLYQRLRQHLGAHIRTILQANTNDPHYNSAVQAVLRIDQAAREVGDKRAKLQAALDALEGDLEGVRQERKQLGARQLLDRSGMDEQLGGLRKQREQLRKTLAEVVSRDLPMLIVRPALLSLRGRLDEETRREQEKSVRHILEEKRDAIAESMRQVSAGSDVAFQRAWQDLFREEPPDGPSYFGHLSAEQKSLLATRIDDVESLAAKRVGELLRALRLLEHKIHTIRRSLKALPADELYLQLEEQERHLAAEIRSISHDLGALSVEISRLDHEAATARRAEEVARRALQLRKDVQTRVDREQTVLDTVSDFIGRLAKAKSMEVQSYLTRMFLQLIRKEDAVREFFIDPDTFAPSVVGGRSGHHDLEALSEGEKEVFALSFLWALGKSAIQEFPMVIDTPFARLDSVHRLRIAERFLPEANRQVIILSTDTEIGTDLYSRLLPSVARSYRLEYDPQHTTTRVVSGYFGS